MMVELEEIVDEPSLSEVADARVHVSVVDESSSAAEDVLLLLFTAAGLSVYCYHHYNRTKSPNCGMDRSGAHYLHVELLRKEWGFLI